MHLQSWASRNRYHKGTIKQVRQNDVISTIKLVSAELTLQVKITRKCPGVFWWKQCQHKHWELFSATCHYLASKSQVTPVAIHQSFALSAPETILPRGVIHAIHSSHSSESASLKSSLPKNVASNCMCTFLSKLSDANRNNGMKNAIFMGILLTMTLNDVVLSRVSK